MGKLKKISGNSVGEMWNFTQIFPTFSLSHNSVPAPSQLLPRAPLAILMSVGGSGIGRESCFGMLSEITKTRLPHLTVCDVV